MKQNKAGRPKKELSKQQKDLAIQYVKTSGFYKNRLANYLGISRKSLYRLLDRDKDFDTQLKRGDAEFCANIIKKAKPDFILKTKYREEFTEQENTQQQVTTVKIVNFSGLSK